MKKLFGLFALLGVLVLAACSNVTEKYAAKINEAAEAGEHYTVEQIREDLGDEAVEVLVFNTGVIYAVKGCESKAEIEELIDAGKEVEGITIVIAGGKAVSAKYSVINEVK
jgi:outer membrane murein-binding lipoprotein Lpp